ncbi:IscA/HesB family protein [Pseudodesulfovibrio tunisiensis]|uniref:IscA/HesB family protein n=1 Tax=Pseudodesulfovibrio tunisiensis TaxID=463192 RepID=UPI001FB1D7FB|nr:IscA/HesB family protein [Pseudodesulfovibrio tunisiensis]
MLTLTETAKDHLDAYFADKEKSDIRVYLASGGCSGVVLTLALDQRKDNDKVIEQGGYSFLINPDLLESTGHISVDASEYGFQVVSENKVGASGSCACSSGCACGC